MINMAVFSKNVCVLSYFYFFTSQQTFLLKIRKPKDILTVAYVGCKDLSV